MAVTKKQLADNLRSRGLVGSDDQVVKFYLSKHPEHAKFIDNNPSFKPNVKQALGNSSVAKVNNAIQQQKKPTQPKPTYTSKPTSKPTSHPKPAVMTSGKAPSKADQFKTKLGESYNKFNKGFNKFEQEHPFVNWGAENFVPGFALTKGISKDVSEKGLSAFKQPSTYGKAAVNTAIPIANIYGAGVGGQIVKNVTKAPTAVKAITGASKYVPKAKFVPGASQVAKNTLVSKSIATPAKQAINTTAKNLKAMDKAIRTPIAKQNIANSVIAHAKAGGATGGILGVTDAANSNVNKDGNLSEFITKPLLYGGMGALGGATLQGANLGLEALGLENNILARLATGITGGAIDTAGLATGDYYMHLTPEQRAEKTLADQYKEYAPFMLLGGLNALPAIANGMKTNQAIRESLSNVKNPGMANAVGNVSEALGEQLGGVPGKYQALNKALYEAQNPAPIFRTPEQAEMIAQAMNLTPEQKKVFMTNIYKGTDSARAVYEAQQKPVFETPTQAEIQPPTTRPSVPEDVQAINRRLMELEEGLEPGAIERNEIRNAVERAVSDKQVEHGYREPQNVQELTRNVNDVPGVNTPRPQETPLNEAPVSPTAKSLPYSMDDVIKLLDQGVPFEEVQKLIDAPLEDIFLERFRNYANNPVRQFKSNDFKNPRASLKYERLPYKEPQVEEPKLPFIEKENNYKSSVKEVDDTQYNSARKALQEDRRQALDKVYEKIEAHKKLNGDKLDYKGKALNQKLKRINAYFDHAERELENKYHPKAQAYEATPYRFSREVGDIKKASTTYNEVNGAIAEAEQSVAKAKKKYKVTPTYKNKLALRAERQKLKELKASYKEKIVSPEEEARQQLEEESRVDKYEQQGYREQEVDEASNLSSDIDNPSKFDNNSKSAEFVTENKDYIEFWRKYRRFENNPKKQKQFLNQEVKRQADKGKLNDFLDFCSDQSVRDSEKYNREQILAGSDKRKDSTGFVKHLDKDLPKNNIPKEEVSHKESKNYKVLEARKLEEIFSTDFIHRDLKANKGILPLTKKEVDALMPNQVDKSIVDFFRPKLRAFTPETFQKNYDGIINKIEEASGLTPEMRGNIIRKVNGIAKQLMRLDKTKFTESAINFKEYDVKGVTKQLAEDFSKLNTNERKALIDKYDAKYIYDKDIQKVYKEHYMQSASEAKEEIKKLIKEGKYSEAEKLLNQREKVIYNDTLYAYDHNEMLKWDREANEGKGGLVGTGDVWNRESSWLDEAKVKAQEAVDNFREQIERGYRSKYQEVPLNHYTQRKYIGGSNYTKRLSELYENVKADKKDIANKIEDFTNDVGDVRISNMPLDVFDGEKVIPIDALRFKDNTLYINPKLDITSNNFAEGLDKLKKVLLSKENINARASVNEKIDVPGFKYEPTNTQSAELVKNATNEKYAGDLFDKIETKATDREVVSELFKNDKILEGAGWQNQVRVFKNLDLDVNTKHKVTSFADAITLGQSEIQKAIKSVLPDLEFEFGKIASGAKGEAIADGIRLDLKNAKGNKFELLKTLIHETHHKLAEKVAYMDYKLNGKDGVIWKHYQEGVKANQELRTFRNTNPEAWSAYSENYGKSPEDIAKETGVDVKLLKEAKEKYNQYLEAGLELEANAAKEGVWQIAGKDIGEINELIRKHNEGKSQVQKVQGEQGVQPEGTLRVSTDSSVRGGMDVPSRSETSKRETNALEDLSVSPKKTKDNISGLPFNNLEDAKTYYADKVAKTDADLAMSHEMRKLSKERERLLLKWEIMTPEQLENRKKMMGVKGRGVFVSQRHNRGNTSVSDKTYLNKDGKVVKVARQAKRRGLKDLSPDEIMRNVIDDHIEITNLDNIMNAVNDLSTDYTGGNIPKGYTAMNDKLLAYCKSANLSRRALDVIMQGEEAIKKAFGNEKELCKQLLEQYERHSKANKLIPDNVIDKVLSAEEKSSQLRSRYGLSRMNPQYLRRLIRETNEAALDKFKQTKLATPSFWYHNRLSNYDQILANSKSPIEAGRNWFKAWQIKNEDMPKDLIDNSLLEAVKNYGDAPKTYSGYTEFDAVANLFGGHLIDDSTLGKVIEVMDRKGRIKRVRNKNYNPLKHGLVKTANTVLGIPSKGYDKIAKAVMKFNNIFETHERKWQLLNDMSKTKREILKRTGQQITTVDEALKYVKNDKNLEALVVKNVEDVLGNYRSFSKAEQKYIKSVIPFYSWYRTALRMNYQLLKKNPARYVRMLVDEQKKREEDRYDNELKKYQEGSTVLPITDKRNNRRIRINPNQYRAINVLREFDDANDITKAINPFAKNTLEAISGRKFFGSGVMESRRYMSFTDYKDKDKNNKGKLKYIDTKTGEILDKLPASERAKYLGVQTARNLSGILGNPAMNLENAFTASGRATQGKGFKLSDKMYDTSFGGYRDKDVINDRKRSTYLPRSEVTKYLNQAGAGLQPEYPLNKREKEDLAKEKIKRQQKKLKDKKAS